MNACLSLVLLIAAAQPERPAAFEIAVQKEGDQVTATAVEHRVVIDVHSKTGIGSATITPKSGKWPQTVVVRFHLVGLERFAITNEKEQVTLSGSVLSYGENAKRLHLSKGGEEQEVEKTSPYWTDIKRMGEDGKPSTAYPLRGGYFEISVPEILLSDPAQELLLSWIDFYRR